MRFAHFSHVWNKPNMSAAQRYEQLWQELELADELGYDYGFCVEHHFCPTESLMPSPTIYCAGAAAHTRRLRLGPMGYIVPLYDPLRIIEDVAVLDNVLDGRLELGLITGISPRFFEHFHGDFANRRARLNEALELVQTAYTDDGHFSYQGEYYHYENVRLSVLPLQRPHPPMWVQSRDIDTLEVLARDGINTGYLFFVPREIAAPRYREYLRGWQQAGHAHTANISYWAPVYVDETDELAVERAAPHIVHAFTVVFGFGDVGGVPIPVLADNFEKRGEHASAEIARHLSDVEYLLERNLVFIGSPETVARRLKEAATEGLFNTFMGEFNIGYLDEESLRRSIRLFGQQVIPALKDFSPY